MSVLADPAGISGQPALERAVDNILAMVRNQREIHFFVDGTPNCGHQAATVQLIKRLIDLTGYAGRIMVVYADIHKGSLGGTADKLALLLPHLDPRRIDTAVLAYGSCEDIRFLDYDRRDALADEARLGFTAGADDMRINFAAELKVKYFVRLQPYLWENDPSERSDQFYVTSRIETAGGACFCPVEHHLPFRSVPYKYTRSQCDSVGEAVWNWFGGEQTFDPQLRVRTRNAQAVYDAHRENSRLRLWPIYGLHHFRDCVDEVAMNLVQTAFQVQEAAPGPVLALVFNFPADIPRFDALIAPLARDSGGRLILLPGDGDISGVLRKATAEAGDCDVIVSVLGPVPGDVYNYFYAHAGFPGIFEGANTASLTMSLGRPYVQMSRAALRFTDPDFILATLDESSEISRHFRALGEYYQQDVHDKCVLGLIALALSHSAESSASPLPAA